MMVLGAQSGNLELTPVSREIRRADLSSSPTENDDLDLMRSIQKGYYDVLVRDWVGNFRLDDKGCYVSCLYRGSI